jgi:polysaccharide biosynthesis protein PslA
VMDIVSYYGSKIGASFIARALLQRVIFGMLAAATDAATIILISIGTGVLYHQVVYQDPGRVADYAQIGLITALLYLIPYVYRSEYLVVNYLEFKRHPARIARCWTVTFVCLITLGFLSKTSVLYSRGWLIIFYTSGLPAIILVHMLLVQAVNAGSQLGLLATKHLFLIGQQPHVREFVRRHKLWDFGLKVAGVAYLSDPAERARSESSQRLNDDLSAAVTKARALDPDGILMIVPWSDQATIDRCIDAFMTVPSSIYLAAESYFDRFENIAIEKIGTVASLHLLHPPLSIVSVSIKRVFDFVIAAAALVLLSPLFILTSILIKLDSPGPAFFLQRRYGFNQKPFRIFKFRTMTTLEDGMNVRQADPNDSRVTRVGRALRRWNIDELPQLINVLLGEMSLVGPRPHAVAHDHAWRERIALYARRHNVKPGITGWAQVSGFRGLIATDEQLRGRIRCDLYYIDNWSIWFDLRILFATVFFPAAYQNAY